MNKIKVGRHYFSEITFNRLFSAMSMRAREIPHLLSWMFSPFSRQNQEHIKRFQGIHEGERCFIVANGPSLKITNLDFLKGEKTFGLNRIYLHFTETSFRPTYYITVNELILEQFAGEIAKMQMPKFLNWNRRSCFDIRDSELIFLKSKMVLKDTFQPDVAKPLVVGATVTFVAMQIAFYMGFQKVILVGLDHKYAEKGVPNKTELRTAARDESHFHPDYFPKGVKWQLPDLLRSEMDFVIARHFFEKKRREIVDATIDGNCPIFKKVDYLSLFT